MHYSSLVRQPNCITLQLAKQFQTAYIKPFINTRVGEIASAFPASRWQYCPTADNPADLLTREITSQQLILSTT